MSDETYEYRTQKYAVGDDDLPEQFENLPDIPDFTQTEVGLPEDQGPLADGWYTGRFLDRWEYTTKDGNVNVFESQDAVSQDGTSRNLFLRTVLTRQSDHRKFNLGMIVNYRAEDLTADAVATVQQAVAARKKGEDWPAGSFRLFMVHSRLGRLQRIAGVRQFQRNGDNSLNLTPLWGKPAYFRIGPDNRDAKYKAVAEVNDVAPKRAKVL